MKKTRLALALIALTACGDDDGPEPMEPFDGGPDATVPIDGGRPDGSMDAKVPDAKADAQQPDASQPDADLVRERLDQKYEVRFDGGNGLFFDRYELEDDHYKKTRTYSNQSVKSCTGSIDRGSGIGTSDLRDSLTASAVISAFSDSDTVLGLDNRPVDGQVLVVKRADGKEIWIGSDCGQTTGCTAIPAAIDALRDELVTWMIEHNSDPAQANTNGSCAE